MRDTHHTRRLFTAILIVLTASVASLAADPGLDLPNDPTLRANGQVSDQKKGSILVYNIYVSSASSPTSVNTRFSITNTNDDLAVAVHLFFVEGASCSVSDRYICLTANQTATMLASEQDPGTLGYLIAIASNFNGIPMAHDFLIGDLFMKDGGNLSNFANLGAEAIGVSTLPLVVFPLDGGSRVRLDFDGLRYNRLPRVLAVDYIASTADGNQTLLFINRFGGDLSTGAAVIGALFGILFNDQEEPHSWTVVASCQLGRFLNSGFPRTTPRFEVVIPAGQSGWMKFWSTSADDPFSSGGRALLGSVIQTSGNAASSPGGFSGARNLHVLKQTPFAALIVPVFPPACGFIAPEPQ